MGMGFGFEFSVFGLDSFFLSALVFSLAFLESSLTFPTHLPPFPRYCFVALPLPFSRPPLHTIPPSWRDPPG